ncbi:MAG: hypothetical protein IPM45_08245 [Acidimicrobiales bacterium]|nr:hypothetical protein [Acidimicrobiales bacterium]
MLTQGLVPFELHPDRLEGDIDRHVGCPFPNLDHDARLPDRDELLGPGHRPDGADVGDRTNDVG